MVTLFGLKINILKMITKSTFASRIDKPRVKDIICTVFEEEWSPLGCGEDIVSVPVFKGSKRECEEFINKTRVNELPAH